MEFVVYFVGPFVLAFIGARVLGQRLAVFGIGFGAFLVVWTLMTVLTAVATKGLGLREGSFLFGLFVSLMAGLCEESTRYLVFRRFAMFEGNHNGRSSTMYALGHHGMETMIVGFTLLLIWAVVSYKPEAISDATTLQQARQMLALSGGLKWYNAFERLSVGFLLHACFSAVVMHCFVRRQIRWLFIAMAWHALHNMIGFNLHCISGHWTAPKIWIAIIVVAYSFLLFRLYRSLDTGPSNITPESNQ